MNESTQLHYSLLSETRRLLKQYGLRAKKGLGQHFLINSGILKHIIEAAELSSSDIVLEVGPGLGVLTRELVKSAGWVIAVELDSHMAEILKNLFADLPNLSIINRDILEIDPFDLINGEKARFPAELQSKQEYKVVANLPYYITGPVLRHFCEAKFKPGLMVIMVQKEVAQSIVAQPGEMSILAVSVQFYGHPRIVGYVPAGNFYPAPKVDSAILKITLSPQPVVPVISEKGFFRIVRAGFSSARKQIVNPLARGLELPKQEVLSLLEKAGISPQKRAEDLSLEEWARLERIIDGGTESG
mgnify:CR=1 FL=1